MIRPLRDILVAVEIPNTGKGMLSDTLIMPENYKQALLTHHKALVLAAGPLAMADCPPGTVIHCSEVWGENMRVGEKKYRIGRLRDIDGVCPGEQVPDYNRYMD